MLGRSSVVKVGSMEAWVLMYQMWRVSEGGRAGSVLSVYGLRRRELFGYISIGTKKAAIPEKEQTKEDRKGTYDESE